MPKIWEVFAPWLIRIILHFKVIRTDKYHFGSWFMSPKEINQPATFAWIILKNMSALFILIGVSIVVAASFLAAFLWSVKNGQYDDDYTPSVRMLFDDKITEPVNTSEIKIQK